MQGQGQGHGAFELPTTSEAVHAGGDDRSPLAGLSGILIYVDVAAFQTEGKLYMILEFLRGGDLFTRLSKEVGLLLHICDSTSELRLTNVSHRCLMVSKIINIVEN